ncbi:MAG: NAD-dependent DNA ligase LigA [Christensenellaceae bacterium]|nr:NAD-dependent DNA ligase LigA [Christensenellaceae bacterium]
MDPMKKLVEQLNEYAYRYYVLDEPTVSDKEYDILYDRLLALEAQTGTVLADSPTRRVGGQVLPGFKKHTHIAPLYSLDKAKTKEELLAWEERLQKAVGGEQRYTLEYKFDGLTLNLTYEGGKLVGAASRGDGITGEEIFEQVKTIRSVPLSIPFTGRMEVQGEGIMRLSALEEYNKTAAEPLKNARNAAAGALRNLDPKVTRSRKLDAFFYNVGYIEGKSFATHREMIAFLQENRFKVSPFERSYTRLDALFTDLDEAENTRDELDFLIDGMVIKIDDFAAREQAGYTQKFPRWAIAYKFEAQEMTTTVRQVEWDVGRTGKLTPTAVMDEVDIGGVTVRRATLNNYEDILRKRVKIGGRVFIRRSNDVIPEVLGAAEDRDDLPMVEKPTHCPACGTPLETVGPNLFCPNTLSCKPQLVARLVHFVSRDAMDLESISEKTAELLFTHLNISDVGALYDLTPEQLLSLPGFKEKKVKNLTSAIEASKRPQLANFIFALGINNVGKKTAKDLAETFGTLEAVQAATFEELTAIRDVGDTVAQCIVDFFASENVQAILKKLADKGVVPIPFEKRKGVFSGKKVVITGTLSAMTRQQAGEKVEQQGGTLQASVGKSTDLLIAGEKAGSKLEKAAKLGVQTIGEEEFLRLLGQ